jgi:hypothetical protein
MDDQRFAGHAWVGTNGEVVVEDTWDHDLIVPHEVEREIAKNPVGFLILYSDRAFHVSAVVERLPPRDRYIAFNPCECPTPPRRQQ